MTSPVTIVWNKKCDRPSIKLMCLRQWLGFISAKESLCNKLKYSNPFIFDTWWCKPLILALNVDFLIQQKSWDICKVIKFQIYIGICVYGSGTRKSKCCTPYRSGSWFNERKRRLQNKFSSAVLFWIIIIHLDWFNNKDWKILFST